MCLNLWQIRNETLAANNANLSYIKERNELLTKAQEIQHSAQALTSTGQFREVFDCSYATLTTYTNERLHRWITMATLTINYDPNLAGGQTTIQTIPLQTQETQPHETPFLPGDAN